MSKIGKRLKKYGLLGSEKDMAALLSFVLHLDKPHNVWNRSVQLQS